MLTADERRIVFSIVTDDIMRSHALYQGALGLVMRALSNPILMFPLGESEFQVVLREVADQLVEFDFGEASTSGFLIALRFFTLEGMNAAAERALEIGATLIGKEESKFWIIRDFNGVCWRLTHD